MSQSYRPISAEARASIQRSLLLVGVEKARAAEACDLACHATEQAMSQLLETATRAGDHGISLMALEIGAQLLANEARVLFGIISRQAEMAGLNRNEVVVVP